jgi:group I intron endonuclease
MGFGVVYLIQNKVNGKVYIGKTCASPPERRWKGHVAARNRERFPLYNAIVKYGTDGFSFVVIAEALCKEGLDDLEKCLIRQFDATNDELGYNLKLGGDGGEHTQAVKDKIAAANRRRIQKEESKRKIGEANKHKAVFKTAEFKAKMRALYLARQIDSTGRILPCRPQ